MLRFLYHGIRFAWNEPDQKAPQDVTMREDETG